MTTLTENEEYALEHLDDRTAWRALIDRREEQFGVDHRTAVRAVAAMRVGARRAAELTKAVAILKRRSVRSDSIKDAIRGACNDYDAWRCVIYVKAGRGIPKFFPVEDELGVVVPHRSSITVGAHFVLRLARLRDEVCGLEDRVQGPIAEYLFNV